MKKYAVRLNIEHEINAEDEQEALNIFWDELNRSQAEEENANITEVK